MSRPLRLALIDNYDSYSYNLVHLFAILNQGIPPVTVLSDEFPSLNKLIHNHGFFDAFILSPGPGNPINLTDFSSLQHDILSSSHPVFAVCLGHQALCYLHGSSIQPLSSGPVHGIVSTITLSPAAATCPLFSNFPSSFSVVRYHSLFANPENISSKLIPTAWTTDVHPHHPTSSSVLMAVRHRYLPHFGVQFHPESICSHYGDKLASNFIHFATRLRSAYSCPPQLSFQEPQHSTPLTKPMFKTIMRNLGQLQLSPISIFSDLFARRKGSFWLDSAVADKHLPKLYKHKANSHTSSELKKLSTSIQSARSSIMGSCDGPHSQLITYDISQNVVNIQKPGCESESASQWNGCIFDYVKQQLRERHSETPQGLPNDMNGGFVGYFGYELKRNMMGVGENKHKSDLPDAWLVFADRFLVFDHECDEIFLVSLITADNKEELKASHKWFDQIERKLNRLKKQEQQCISASIDNKENRIENRTTREKETNNQFLLKFVPERSRSEYLQDIAECLRAIELGESYEVCLTNRLRARIPEGETYDALELYAVLRSLNPAPYSAFLYLSDNEAVCCSSPERFLTISSSGRVESKPIKGTRRRGRSVQEDQELRLELENSSKDRSENLMIVDLVRNDLSRTCQVGSVQVPKLMHVESYASVHQLVSTVTGRLEHDKDVVDCIKAAYPMGSMTGAPKIRTMEIIDSIETSARGVYSGTIGYISVAGAANLNVVIRTAVIRHREIRIGAGGAIVSKSCAEDEYDETILKGKALMQSIAMYFTGDVNAYVVQHEA